MQRPISLAALVLMGIAAGTACLDATTTQTDAATLVERAVCVIQPTTGSEVHGVIHFTTDAGTVLVEGKIEGLEPGSSHGFHIHQFGDMTDSSGKSLGGHYNPGSHDHALPESEMRHAGDLGNLVAGEDGAASFSASFDNFSLGGTNDVIGRGMVVHAAPDDGGQPTGNAGARAAVGVIGIAK
ncbi:MAG: Cu-Zn family superoxide dismutase [Planctomycetota bacterium]|jgi:Cu-Zn family superoxide dismutase